ncbi:MAG: glycoside hydrolase family 16 protein [Pseudonocardiaceae bacterium]
MAFLLVRRTLFNIRFAAVVVMMMVMTIGCAPDDSVTAPPRGSGSCLPPSNQNASTGVDEHSAAAKFSWHLTHRDEFAGTCIDARHWVLYNGPGSGGVGLRRPSAISVSGGELRITARGAVSGGMAWVGPATTYGRWEVRMRADPGVGYSAVSLLWPDSDRWPADGEVDFAEITAPSRDRNNFTVHWGTDNSQDSATLMGDFSQWHDYAVEWEPDHLTMFVDGVPVYNTTDSAAIPHAPMHLALQQDVLGDDEGNPLPSVNSNPAEVTMHVDWARMYGR